MNKPLHSSFNLLGELKDEVRKNYESYAKEYKPRREKPFKLEFRKRVYRFGTPNGFIYAVLKAKVIHNPIWRIVIPHYPNTREGAIYYIAESSREILVYRGSYGYNGSSPLESAFIEVTLEKLGFSIETRHGDYLLACLGIW